MKAFRRQSVMILLGTLVVAGALVSGVVRTQGASAATPVESKDITIQTEVLIPGSLPDVSGGFLRGKVRDAADYIGIIYNFLISTVGLVAGVFILVGGFQYMTAGGDTARVGAAKRRIGNALIGMILALSGYILLNTINPELVNLKLPDLTTVKTESFFLPFCDDLAKQYGLSLQRDIVNVGHASGHAGSNNCGNAGYYVPPGQEEVKGQETETGGVKAKSGKLWCIFRGEHLTGPDRLAAYKADYGCSDGEVQDDGIIFDGSFKYLSVCLPYQGVSPNSLDKEFEEKGFIGTKLASCTGCVNLIGYTMRNTYNMSGDSGCQAWQNTANNGNPNDFSFSYAHKQALGIYQDTRIKGGNRTTRMYYCGYSQDKDRCIYVPLDCSKVSSCSDYTTTSTRIGKFFGGSGNNFSIHYCVESGPGHYSCHGSQKLGSKMFTDTGEPTHLLPICTGNPCDAGGAGHKCKVPGLAGYADVPGANQVRVLGRVLTAGLTNDVKCE